MLPASLQIPAAVVLVLGGGLACFFGYRLFRVVLSIYGFVIGALIATSIVGTETTTTTLLAALVGGVAGALALNVAYFIGVALIGAGAGAAAAAALWNAMAREPHVFVVIGFAVAGAIVATILQRHVIVLVTAFGGAWTLLVGGLALAGDPGAQAAAASDTWVLYPLDPAPGRAWVPWVWLGLGLVGTVVQFAAGAPVVRTKKRKKPR